MPLQPGTRLGVYEVTSQAGAGGMGEVYRARDTRLDRVVAIKVLPAHVAADQELRQRFEREAKAIASLNHPHICTLHDVGNQDGFDFLVMEFLEGETLAQRLARGALPLEQALQIASQIADALDKAHRQGIVHRDLKPGNIMLTKSGAKLLDFGLAKLRPAGPVGTVALSAAPTARSPLTGAGSILGTVQYMAPEQLEGQEADVRTDIFAFGAVLYEALTGTKAFDGKTQASLIAAILERNPPPLATLQPLMPLALDRIVKKCLAKNPDDRWQTTHDLLDELRWTASEGARTNAVVPGSVNAGSLRGQRAAWAIAAMALLAAVLLAVPASRSLRQIPNPAVRAVRLEMTTAPTDDFLSFAVSPDGQSVVFVANDDDGVSRLWVRPLDQSDARPLVGTEGATYPFWSPDSRSIGFFADLKLKRTDLAGGSPEALADAPSGRGGAWNRDGVILFAPTSASGLARVNASGGPVTPLEQGIDGKYSLGIRWPQFLPDGRHFLAMAYLAGPELQGTYFGSLDGGDLKRVMPGELSTVYAAPGYLLALRGAVLMAWHFDPETGTVSGDPLRVDGRVGSDNGLGRTMVSTSSAGVLVHRAGNGTQRRQLVWADRTGRVMGPVVASDDVGSMGSPELSPDGRRVLMHRSIEGNVDLWMTDVNRGVETRFSFERTPDAYGVWSPDGIRVVSGAVRTSAYDLFEKPSNDTAAAERLLIATTSDKRPLSWSSDGRFIVFVTFDLKSGADIWALPMTGERKAFPVLQTQFAETEAQFSPDGRWLAYTSNESGRPEVYVRPFQAAGETLKVSANGGMGVRWRRDGRELFYIAPDERLTAVSVSASREGATPQLGTATPLFRTRLATGANVQSWKPQYDVAADGRFLMNTKVDGASAPPIGVILNWDAALKP